MIVFICQVVTKFDFLDSCAGLVLSIDLRDGSLITALKIPSCQLMCYGTPKG